MKKTIAQRYWREFEILVLEYLKDTYHITKKGFSRLTPPTGDGGYDGVIYWIKNTSQRNIQETLFEAKLRTTLGHTLSMNDFSKALIIAVNRFSDELYIATNISFSLETMQQLKTYSKRTGITIKTLNGKDLYEWFQKFSLHTDLNLKIEFIDFLKESAKKIPNDCLVNIYNNNKQTTTSYVQDYTRGKSIDELQCIISDFQKGTVLIEGNRGSGKSRLCEDIQDTLKAKGYLLAEIDVKYTNSSREIFLALLRIVWAISPETVIDYSESELALIFSKIGDEVVDRKKIDCFKQIFYKNIEEYAGHWDIYQLYLIDLIDKLFAHYTLKKKHCIHIHNLDTGYYESCIFVLKIISKLQKYNILFLIELRSDYNGDLNIKSDEWKKIYTRFMNLSSLIKKYYVYELSSEEKEKYITIKLPQLSKNQIAFLREKVSDNPLILNSTLEILTPKISNQMFLDVEFRSALDFFRRTYKNEIVSQMIRYKVRFGGFEKLTMPLAIISLLNGKCSIACMQKIIEYDKSELIEDLLNIGMFYIRNDIIEIKHELYLNSLHNHSDYISITLLQKLAKMMLEKINIFYNDALQKEMLRLELLKILGDKQNSLVLSCELGKTLLKQGDFQQALRIYENGYSILESISYDDVKYTLFRLEILKKMLYIHANSKGDNSNNVQRLLEIFHNLIIQNRRGLRHNEAYIDARLNEIIFEMKRLHRLAQHHQCLKYAYKARRLARKVDAYHKHPETMEQILWLKSLSVKHVSGIHACMQSFKNDILKNPDLPLLMYSYNTHKAAALSGKNPWQALKYFKANEKYYMTLSMAEQLHNRVNIANMYFFLRKYTTSVNLAYSIINDALAYDIKQELGRIYNLMGNYYTIFKSPGKGIEFYNKAIQIFGELQNQIHFWVPLVNISSVYLDNKDYSNALKYLEMAINIIRLRKNELRCYTDIEVNSVTKMHIGIIIILHILHDISLYVEKAGLIYNQLAEELKKIISPSIHQMIRSIDKYQNFFKNSVYEHNSKIILKV